MATANQLSTTHSTIQLKSVPFTVVDISDWNTVHSANRQNQLKSIIDCNSVYSPVDRINQAIIQIKQFNAQIQTLAEKQSELVAGFWTSPAPAVSAY